MTRRWLRLALLLILIHTGSPAYAQESQPTGPIYVVQYGDNLWDIAVRFGLSVEDLVAANNIVDPGQIKEGDQLVIPGLEGIEGILTTQTIPFGESLRSLSLRYAIPESMLARLNHLTSPIELIAGTSLVLPENETSESVGGRFTQPAGLSLLEVALIQKTNPWDIVATNALSGTWSALPGEVYHFPGAAQAGPGAFPAEISAAQIDPEQLVQGKAADIWIDAEQDLSLHGTLNGREFSFFPVDDGRYVALYGIHAMTKPGSYPLVIQGTLPDGTPFGFSQSVMVGSGDYPFDPILNVDPATIDPEVTQPEDAEWAALTSPVTPEKMWEGPLQVPVDPLYADCWPSRFGSRRAYNDNAYDFFHTGLDFCGGVGDAIYAPAAGVVVFSGPLLVRGIATVINHGWGVYTAYLHQSETLVEAGDVVETGQLIGRVGGTGRATGPHLHWEVWVNGVQTDPMDWLEGAYP